MILEHPVVLLKIAVIYTKVLEYVCYAVSCSEYGETAPLKTMSGAILGAPCKLDSWYSWVMHKFVGNMSNFGSSEQTKHFNNPTFWIL